jgi:ribosome-binding protein aMBF1 (putative translation factor)
MIRTEAEYRRSVERVGEQERRIADQRDTLRSQGYKKQELKRLLEPQRTFLLEMKQEIEEYERLRRGDVGEELLNLTGLGRTLIKLRIASGLSQKELADRLEVHESQVSRDERNEYHGITAERASRILEALGYRLRSEVEPAETAHA